MNRLLVVLPRLCLVLGLLVPAVAAAQSDTTRKEVEAKPWYEEDEQLYNSQSVDPVRKDDIMFKRSLWFRVNLHHKQNWGFFARNHELPRLLMDAVISGEITPYYSDSLTRKMPLSVFLERLEVPTGGNPDPLDEALSDPFGDGGFSEGGADSGAASDDMTITGAETATGEETVRYFPRQLYLMEIKEDLIFDQRRSRLRHDLLAISILIPSTENPLGLEEVVCSFSYKELATKFFKHRNPETQRIRDNPKAIWFNPANSGRHLNLADAFQLRLFSGRLIKYENVDGSDIIELYGQGRRGLEVSEQYLYKLMEYEYTLWEP